jgi:hypothetical protein
VVSALLLVCLLGACSEATNERPWYVSRFGGPERKWRPQAGRPVVSQKKPAMLIYEVSQYREAAPTPEQRAAAEVLRSESMLAAVRHGWYDFDVALAAGYELMFSDDVHYVNEEFAFDDAVLDPDRPEFLMYYQTSRGMSLVGFMYYVAGPDARGDQIGGGLTTWHYHVWSRPQCLLGGLLAVDVPNLAGECARGKRRVRSPEMLHVWLIDHPEGAFATRMQVRPAVLERLIERRGF